MSSFFTIFPVLEVKWPCLSYVDAGLAQRDWLNSEWLVPRSGLSYLVFFFGMF